jgi:hypothetical protein
MNKKLLDALETCLERMEHGEPLDSVLAYYPELAAQLRPLLATAIRAKSANPGSLPAAVLERQRGRGLELAVHLRHEKKHHLHHLLLPRFWRPVATILSVIAILVMSGNGVLIASAHSIPGDTLYPLKRSVESTQLQLASDPTERQVLEQKFSELRVEETKSLISIHRVESVEFTGVVSGQSDDEWLVSGIPVEITTDAETSEGIEVGEEIDVHGSTSATGEVNATRLSRVEPADTDDNPPVMAPTQTPSPEGNWESGAGKTPTETAVSPTPAGDGSGSALTTPSEQHSSSETQTPQHDSEGGEDQPTGHDE